FRGRVPGQSLREGAGGGAETAHQSGITRQLQPPIGQPARISVGDEISRDAVAYRFAESRTVRRERGSTACGRFDVGDAPAFLGTREYHRPGSASDRTLFVFRNKSQKSDP